MRKNGILLLFTAMIGSANAAIVATGDTFSANTLANYVTANGYTLSYNATGSPNFGDGADDGFITITIPGSNGTGSLTASVGTVEAADVGKQLSLVFSLDGRNSNFHADNVSFISNGVVLNTTTLFTGTFPEWNDAGTAAVVGGTLGNDWRLKNGVGTLTYTIQAGDVGNTLGWKFASAGTSSGGYSFGLDNWSLNVVPEPSSAMLGGLAAMCLAIRRRR